MKPVGGPFSSLRVAQLAALASLATLASGCLTNFGQSVRLVGAGGDELEQENPLAGNSSSSSLITLSRVVRSSLTPTANLDLHGDGSNAFGQYCQAVGGSGASSGNDGPSTCACNYAFTLSDGTTQEFDVDTLYREDNMIRCPYTAVPADVANFQVRVHLINVDVYSNALTFRRTGTGISASPVDSSTFLPVLRYQCKQSLFVPHAMDSNVLDPFLSEDGIFSLLIDFHTTNLGAAMAYFANPARSGAFSGTHARRGWVCPTTPNDSTFGADLTVYSVAPDSSGNRRIFPPSDPNLDRATFYMAKEMTGVFTVPFNTYSIPFEATRSPSSSSSSGGSSPQALPPIGYGAPPVRNTVDGEESCPGADVAIPSGYRWVKVWSFRGTILRPAYPTSSSLQGIRGISCNPGLRNAQSTDGSSTFSEAIIPACGSVRQQIGALPDSANSVCDTANRTSLTAGNATGSTIADRVIWDSTGNRESAACAKINPGGTTDITGALFDTYDALSLGADTWRRYNDWVDDLTGANAVCDRYTISGSEHHLDFNPAGTASAPEDCSSPFNVFNLCGSYGSLGLLSDVNPNQTLGGPYPNDSARRAPASEAAPDWSAPYDSANGGAIIDSTPLQDFLYVVTPTNVMTRHMLDPSETGIGAVYRPYRFFSSGDCSSPDPTSPGLRPDGTPDCPSNRRITYRFVNRDQSVNDPSSTGDDPNIVRGYPICALQPIEP
jgi:hypothetical protein